LHSTARPATGVCGAGSFSWSPKKWNDILSRKIEVPRADGEIDEETEKGKNLSSVESSMRTFMLSLFYAKKMRLLSISWMKPAQMASLKVTYFWPG